MSGAALAAAAEGLLGVPFRLHGRDPQSGLDCIGVLAVAMAAIGRPIALPNGYALRRGDIAPFRPLAGPLGFAAVEGRVQPGDVVVFAIGPAQFHLGIAAPGSGFIHAHAGLRRVVLGPAGSDWRPAGHWRLIED